MVFQLPQDQRVIAQQQAFGELQGAITDHFQKKEDKEKGEKANKAYKELIGKLDPDLLEKIKDVSDPGFIRDVAVGELEKRSQRNLMKQYGLIDDDEPIEKTVDPSGDFRDDVSTENVKEGDFSLLTDRPEEKTADIRQAPMSTSEPKEKPGSTGKKQLKDMSEGELTAMIGSGNKDLKVAAEREFKNRKESTDRDIKAAEHERKLNVDERRKFESDRSLAEKRNEAHFKEREASEGVLFEKERALKLSGNAIASGKPGAFSKDVFAEALTRIPVIGPLAEALRSPEGAVMKTAQKELLLGNIQRAGQRPNMWIEQQIADMQPKIGRTMEANLTVNEILETNVALEKLRNEISYAMEEEEVRVNGFAKPGLAHRVDEELRVKGQGLQDRLAFRTRAIHDGLTSKKQLRKEVDKPVPDGTYLTPIMAEIMKDKVGSPEKVIQRAKQLGYTIPTRDQVAEWSNAI